MNYKIFLIISVLFCSKTFAQKQKVWLDTDMGNEMDDVWAAARLLAEKDKYEIVAMSSAHFNNADLLTFDKWNQYDTKNISTINISQAENIKVLEAFKLLNIPHPKGADRSMGRAWGEQHPRPSEATDLLLKTIKNLAPNEKLDIIFIGTATNIASAIKLDPSIVPKIRLYNMGGRYNAKTKVWNKDEFNIRIDLNAANLLWNTPNLEWYIMPCEACGQLVFDKKQSYEKCNTQYPIEALLKNRWIETNGNDNQRTLWDLAIIEAYLSPELATKKWVKNPPENIKKKVWVYTDIDEKAMENKFWEKIHSLR